MTGEGNTRRLTAEQEERAAEHFARGASERQVADVLDVGTGTANRLRHRLAGRIAELAALAAAVSKPGETAVDGQQDESAGAVLRDSVDTAMRGELLEQLGTKRDELAAQLADLGARADASRQALAGLETERLALLASGQDAAPLRPRAASAREDLNDWKTAAALLAQQIAIGDARIAEVQAEQQLAELREQLAPAAAGRDAAIRATGGRMAGAVLAVRAAAEEFTAALADEAAARDRADRLAAEAAALAASLGEPAPYVPDEPESTILPLRGGDIGGPELALYRALGAARDGDAVQVAAYLAEAFGWVPPSREEQAAEAERQRQMRAEWERQMLQPTPAPQPWTRPGGSSFGVDENGREVGWAGYRAPLAPHPLDAYRGI